MRILAVLAIVSAVACGGDDGPPLVPDCCVIDGAEVDAAVIDAPEIPDCCVLADAEVDAAMIDAAVDAGAASLGPVDCRIEDDCPGISTCNLSAPGGVCTGCGTDADCPGGTTCMGALGCVRECNDDPDCSVGKLCLPATGRCAIRTCAAGCPAPYVCGGTHCQRPTCGPGGTCPAPMTCGAGNLCMEP